MPAWTGVSSTAGCGPMGGSLCRDDFAAASPHMQRRPFRLGRDRNDGEGAVPVARLRAECRAVRAGRALRSARGAPTAMVDGVQRQLSPWRNASNPTRNPRARCGTRAPRLPPRYGARALPPAPPNGSGPWTDSALEERASHRFRSSRRSDRVSGRVPTRDPAQAPAAHCLLRLSRPCTRGTLKRPRREQQPSTSPAPADHQGCRLNGG
jgi:hypothetical protein